MSVNPLDKLIISNSPNQEPPAEKELEALKRLLNYEFSPQQAAELFSIPLAESTRRGEEIDYWRIWGSISDGCYYPGS